MRQHRERAVGEEVGRTAVLFLAARAALLRGELEVVRGVGESIGTLSRKSPFPYVRALNLVLSGRIALAEGRFADAAALFAEAAPLQEQTRFTVLYGDAPLFRATIATLEGREAEALALLGPCLQFYLDEGSPGLLAWQGAVVSSSRRCASLRPAVSVAASFARPCCCWTKRDLPISVWRQALVKLMFIPEGSEA